MSRVIGWLIAPLLEQLALENQGRNK